MLCKTFIIRTEKKSNKKGMFSRGKLGTAHNISTKQKEELHESASQLTTPSDMGKKEKARLIKTTYHLKKKLRKMMSGHINYTSFHEARRTPHQGCLDGVLQDIAIIFVSTSYLSFFLQLMFVYFGESFFFFLLFLL